MKKYLNLIIVLFAIVVYFKNGTSHTFENVTRYKIDGFGKHYSLYNNYDRVISIPVSNVLYIEEV